MTTFRPSHPQATTKADPGWQDYFGPSPRGDPIITNPYSGYPRETLALPDVYKGNNPYLTNIMIDIISEDQLVPTRILLPLRTTENETSVTWDEFHFTNGPAGPVPEEGISRLVTQQISERRDHYIRYGLAFMIEHGFMQSPKGQMTYKMNLEQIKDAVLQSLYIGVIEALLRCKTNSQFFSQQYGKSLTALSARKRLEMECESFAEIQKSDHGWEMLNSRAQRNLKLNGVQPDAWVVDDGVKKYIASRRESWAYFLHGSAGEKLRLENQGVGDPKSLDIASNCLIFETKQFNFPGMDDPVNITSRKRAIGEYMVSFPHLDYASCGKYTSSMRDIMVYDEDRDGFAKLSLSEGLEHCQRFNKHSGDLDAHGFVPKDHGEDMFFTNEHPRGVQYFAQMKGDDMPKCAIRDWITSVLSQFEPKTKSELYSNLEILKDLVEKLDGGPSGPDMSNINTQKFFTHVQDAYTLGVEPGTADESKFDEATGMLRLDELFKGPLRCDASITPYGFGSYAGICEMAKHSTKHLALSEDARSAKSAIDMITSKIDTVCFGNMFTQQFSVPFYFTDKCTKAAVFCNLIHTRLPPMVVIGREFDLQGDLPANNVANQADQDVYKQLCESLHLSRVTEDMQKGDDAYAKADNLVAKLAKTVMGYLGMLSHQYREKLLVVLKSKKMTVETLEQLYTMFMSQMQGQTWYTLSKALEGIEDDAPGQLCENLEKFRNRLATNGKMSIGETSQVKTVITQLTCSPIMAQRLKSNNQAPVMRGVPRIVLSYTDKINGSNTIMANLSAGAQGDEEGFEATGSGFALKRNRAGAPKHDNTTETSDAWWSTDGTITESVEDVKGDYAQSLERIFGLAFLGNAVHNTTLKRFISSGCVFPFNVIYARPFQTYSLSTGICMKAGATTGETLVGHADFQLGDNIIQKLHYGNFTFHSKSVVYRHQQVYQAQNMFSTAYNGGCSAEFFSGQADYDKYMESGNSDMRQKSIFALLAPYSSKAYANPIDITGRHSGNLHPLNLADDQQHYASACFYSRYWGWSENSVDAPGRCAFDSGDDSTANTVCFQGHQSLYNPSCGGMFDIVIKNTGHWGCNVYPGVGKVRNGHQKVVENITYNNLFGGGGNLSGMLK